MKKNRKFDPCITRVPLCPEQAVLSCNCHAYGYWRDSGSPNHNGDMRQPCISGPKKYVWDEIWETSASSS